MKIVVSQRSLLIDGKPGCPRCGRRPRKAIPAGTKAYAQGRRWYGYCAICAPEVEFERRQSMMRVSAEERELILELRQAQPTGRHHAGLPVDRDGWWRRMLVPCVMNVALCSLALWVPLVVAFTR